MLEETDSLFDGLDRRFLDWSSRFAEPLCWASGMLRYRFVSPLDPGKFDNTTNKVKEIATRFCIFSSAALAFAFAGTHLLLTSVVIGAASQIFRVVGFALQKNRFTHVKGSAVETPLDRSHISVLSWDICGEYGGLSYRNGGVVHWRSRLEKIVEKINAENPDVIVLQGIHDTALTEALIQRLPDYAHFFTHMGGSALKNSNGCMVITKHAVEDFSHTELPHGDSYERFTLKNGLGEPVIRFFATTLQSEGEDRIKSLSQVIDKLSEEKSVLPTLSTMTNANLNNPEERDALSKYFHHSYRGQDPTSTDQLAMQWDAKCQTSDGKSDLISLVKRTLADGSSLPVLAKVKMDDCHLVEGFNSQTFDTKTALSNHHGILTEISWTIQP